MPPLDQIHDPVSYTAVMAIVVAMAAMAVMGSIPEMVMAKSSTGIQDHINWMTRWQPKFGSSTPINLAAVSVDIGSIPFED